MHDSPAPQSTPQEPQLNRSVARLTQAVPHWASPGEQPATQRLDWQSWPATHLFPQLPQLFPSDSVFTQEPSEHWVSGAEHWQRPVLHCSSPLQVFPHAPQFVRSFCASTQRPLQLVRPPVQAVRQTPA